MLEAAVDDVVLDLETGSFHVTGAPGATTFGWADIAAEETAAGDPFALKCEADFEPDNHSVPYGAHAAVVEVFHLSPLPDEFGAALPFYEVFPVELFASAWGSSRRKDVAVAPDALDYVFLLAVYFLCLLLYLFLGRPPGRPPELCKFFGGEHVV